MPELPEVETIVRALGRFVVGRTIESVSIPDPSVIHGLAPRGFARRVKRGKIESIARRGKYIVIRLDNRVDVIIHLRMTGQLRIGAGDWDRDADALPSAMHAKAGALGSRRSRRKQLESSASSSFCSPRASDPYLRVGFRLDGGRILVFRDVRRFGQVRAVPRGEYASIPGLAGLGPEPLGRRVTPEQLRAALSGRRAPVKSLLMDQRVIAGIGNIYASEILHAAGVDPRRPGSGIRRAEARAIFAAVREVLRTAIRDEGTTFRDYRGPRGSRGGYRPRVYKREGEPCPVCRAAILRSLIGGRSTFYCPRCQK